MMKIKETVKHQEIGGQYFEIEKEFRISDALDMPFNSMNIAMYNFISRRMDLMDEKYENMKLYYGHVGMLGYFVAEDELEEINEK